MNPDGSIDGTFIVGAGPDSSVEGITLANDGSSDIYVTGSFNTFNAIPSRGIVRLNSDGSVDPSFVVTTGLDRPGYQLRAYVASSNDGSGAVYVGGDFRLYNGTVVDSFVRLLADGTID